MPCTGGASGPCVPSSVVPDSPSGWDLYREVLPASDGDELQAQFTFAWSTVHGLAVLLGAGRYTAEGRAARIASTLDLVETAIAHRAGIAPRASGAAGAVGP